MNNFSGFDHLAPERDRQFLSMGFVMQILQATPGQLRVLMEACEIKFSQTVDGIGYLLVEDAEKLATECNKLREEIRSVEASHERN